MMIEILLQNGSTSEMWVDSAKWLGITLAQRQAMAGALTNYFGTYTMQTTAAAGMTNIVNMQGTIRYIYDTYSNAISYAGTTQITLPPPPTPATPPDPAPTYTSGQATVYQAGISLGGIGGLLTGGAAVLETAAKAGWLQKIIMWSKGALTIGGAAFLLDQLISGKTGAIEGAGMGGLTYENLKQELGMGTDWRLGGIPEIPGEDVIKVWGTGSTYFCRTYIGHFYVLTKNGWKKYTPRAPIVLGTRNLTPRKLIRALNKYYKLHKSLDNCFKKTKRPTQPQKFIK